jgi:hypothetical protein
VSTAASCYHLDRGWQCAHALLELAQGSLAVDAVDVEHPHTRSHASGKADIGVGVLAPPRANLLEVGGGV